MSDLPVIDEKSGYELRRGTLADGTDAGTLRTYLEAALAGNLSKFASAPTVRFVGNSTEPELVERTLSAIRLVNAALPTNSRIRVTTRMPVASVDGSANTIYVEFVDTLSTAGRAWTIPNADGTLRYAHIALNRDSQFSQDLELFAVHLVAHELLHALGMRGHVDIAMRSIMSANNGIFHLADQPVSVLHPADREALRAMYGRLDNLDYARDLGPWIDSGHHLAANGQHHAFGAVQRVGYVEPWAYGPTPSSPLADNNALSGEVSWEGLLLGWSQGSAVSGDARIGVQLATLTGSAVFTGLEHHANGTMWGDGDLGYLIAVSGNTFRETGGDAGTLTGIFTGRAHEGAAGTLERTDLTAAFGAER